MAEENKKSAGAVIGTVCGVVALGTACGLIGWFVRDMMPEKKKEPTPQMIAWLSKPTPPSL